MASSLLTTPRRLALGLALLGTACASGRGKVDLKPAQDALAAELHEAASQTPIGEKGQILSRIWEFFGFRAGARL